MASIREKGNGKYEITISNGYTISGKKIRVIKTVQLDTKLSPKKMEKEIQNIAYEF